MNKRKGFASKHKFGLKRHKSLPREDKISKLPDEILVSILSLLTITEAGRTSILSHRWEKLWMSYSGVLDFDIRNNLVNEPNRKLWPWIHKKFVHNTTKVLDGMLLSESPPVSAFTLRFSKWYEHPKRVIDKFVEFAMAKRFQRLEFDFDPKGTYIITRNRYYFPQKFYDWIKQPCGLSSISSLTSLTLRNIKVTGEFIEGILSNCPLLERLCVENSQKLTKLNVTGVAVLNLKYLMLWGGNFESLVVSAPNLLCLSVIGEGMKWLHIENVPKLVDVSVSYVTYMSSSSLSSHSSQFETLSFQTFIIEDHDKFTPYVVLNKLKHLILQYTLCERLSIVGWMTFLIEASPFLEKFTYEARVSHGVRKKQKEVPKPNVPSVQHPHQCLKVVEMVGFSGIVTELELVMYILENAIALEQIIINRCSAEQIGTPFELHGVDTHLELQVKEQRAMQLKNFVPPGVDFILI